MLAEQHHGHESLGNQVPNERPNVLLGSTYKIRRPTSEHAVYVTINDFRDEEGQRRPFEIFINCKAGEVVQYVTALTRMISAIFQAGGDVAFVGRELQCISDPDDGWWQEGVFHRSLVGAIGHTILEHLGKISGTRDIPADKVVSLYQTCKSCGQKAAILQEGCITCTSCGYNRCG